MKRGCDANYETESSRVVIDELSSNVPVRRKDAGLQSSRPQVIFHEHVGDARLFSV
jgi:hypothetical protein